MTTTKQEMGADPKPVAVISDVHGNLPALEAVLTDIADHGIERIWCLGDTAGYGADAVPCLRLVREHCELVLAGNHDLAVVGDEPIDRFGMHARPGVALAMRQLGAATDGRELRDWLAACTSEFTDAVTSIVAAHGCPSPFDSVWDYIDIDVAPFELSVALDSPPLVLVGHSHVQRFDGVVCNPGAVGQPRDGDPRAAWARIPNAEPDERGFMDVELHRVAYDVERTQRSMRRAGLPAMTITRLATGE